MSNVSELKKYEDIEARFWVRYVIPYTQVFTKPCCALLLLLKLYSGLERFLGQEEDTHTNIVRRLRRLLGGRH